MRNGRDASLRQWLHVLRILRVLFLPAPRRQSDALLQAWVIRPQCQGIWRSYWKSFSWQSFSWPLTRFTGILNLLSLHLCKYHWKRLQLFRLLASNSPSPYSASSCFKFPLPLATPQQNLRDGHLGDPNPLPQCHSWRSVNVEACMLLILNHICWTSRIQTPTGSCFQRPGLVTVGKSSASACCQLRSEGAFKSRLCRLLTLSKTCKPWLSHKVIFQTQNSMSQCRTNVSKTTPRKVHYKTIVVIYLWTNHGAA